MDRSDSATASLDRRKTAPAKRRATSYALEMWWWGRAKTIREITRELEALARTGKLTLTRYLALAARASHVAAGDTSALFDVLSFLDEVQPDYDALRTLHLELARAARSETPTPLSSADLVERARIAVGPNGARFVEQLRAIGFEPELIAQITAEQGLP